MRPPPPIEIERGADGKRLKGKEKTLAKKRAMSARALADFRLWVDAQKLSEAAE